MEKKNLKVLAAQLCLTFYNSMYCSPLGSPVHGILQARILNWVAIPFSRGLPEPGTEPGFPVLQADSLPSEPPRNVHGTIIFTLMAESQEEIRSLLLRVKGEWKSYLKTQYSKNEDHGIWSHHLTANRWEKTGNGDGFCFLGLQNYCRVSVATKLKNTCSLEEKLWKT